LRLNDAGLAKIHSLIKTDTTAATYFTALHAYGTKLLDEPLINCTRSGVENSLLSQARRVLDRTYTLGLLHRLLNNDTTFANRAIREMVHVSTTCTNWNPSHFLDVAEMTHAVAIGYDWLYGAISAADRKTIESAAITKGLQAGLTAYGQRAWWQNSSTNWNFVCNGGLLAGALGFADVASSDAASVYTKAVHGLPFAFQAYSPNGGWSEGTTYWYILLRTRLLHTQH
jgi:hypothetical protein